MANKRKRFEAVVNALFCLFAIAGVMWFVSWVMGAVLKAMGAA